MSGGEHTGIFTTQYEMKQGPLVPSDAGDYVSTTRWYDIATEIRNQYGAERIEGFLKDFGTKFELLTIEGGFKHMGQHSEESHDKMNVQIGISRSKRTYFVLQILLSCAQSGNPLYYITQALGCKQIDHENSGGSAGVKLCDIPSVQDFVDREIEIYETSDFRDTIENNPQLNRSRLS